MNSRLWLLTVLLLASFNLAEAQQPTKISRMGYISGTGNETNQGPYVEALRQGLRELGYIEGKNLRSNIVAPRERRIGYHRSP